eukprot:scaffold650_cov407-Prasinococcus_capsulatus_cf.AAC.27
MASVRSVLSQECVGPHACCDLMTLTKLGSPGSYRKRHVSYLTRPVMYAIFGSSRTLRTKRTRPWQAT